MMKQLLLGIAVAGVLALPVATAHIVWRVPVEQEDGSIRCELVVIGDPSLPPHGSGSVLPCIPPPHGSTATLP
jgi:hypothetical protein